MEITAKVLREMLADIPDDFIVCTAGDDEGNSFRSLDDGYNPLAVGQWDPAEREFTTWDEEDDDGNEQQLKPEDCNAVCIW